MYTRPRIIPVLLIDDRDLVKTIRFKNKRYLGDPVNAVKIFNRKRVDELAILDISASRLHKSPDFSFLEDIASEAFMPLSYGGGITDVNQAKKLLAIGYEKITINTAFTYNPQLIKDLVSSVGSQSVVVSIDAVRKNDQYYCVINDGTKKINKTPQEMAILAEKLGAGEILLNSVNNDGKMQGYDIELVKKVADCVNVPVIACGGAGGIQDLKKVLHDGHAHAASGGSMFVYYGRLNAVLITAPSEEELIEAGIYDKN